METLKQKRNALVSVLELLLEVGSDPSCRQGSIGRRLEVSCGVVPSEGSCLLAEIFKGGILVRTTKSRTSYYFWIEIRLGGP